MKFTISIVFLPHPPPTPHTHMHTQTHINMYIQTEIIQLYEKKPSINNNAFYGENKSILCTNHYQLTLGLYSHQLIFK